MTKEQEALKLALEALELANINHWWGSSKIEAAITAIKEALAQPAQEPDYKEALRVLSLALEESPQNLTPKQRSVWQQSKDVLLSGGGLA